uniref:Non-structural protein 2 n=1 Tax=Ovine respiratory syncytial virus (strain WSU 83-1578) TaxID=79699 RepID=NS2_ORSVW|nr:RecName: Full=Non-structural protein 2; Short=NS2; AltName: Full=Non-structural protein 1B [Ovine respiratory syncytial virus (strain WSU 83-1578)]AAA42813.1 nonstructural protein [Ovine respiratory syncytial virus]
MSTPNCKITTQRLVVNDMKPLSIETEIISLTKEIITHTFIYLINHECIVRKLNEQQATFTFLVNYEMKLLHKVGSTKYNRYTEYNSKYGTFPMPIFINHAGFLECIGIKPTRNTPVIYKYDLNP